MRSSIALLATIAVTNNQYTPSFPVGIVAWIVCNARKRSEYGGWLLYFHWQLYAGVLMTAFLFWTNLQSYVPENFSDNRARHYWFLLSTVPTLVLFLLQVAVSTILISARTWDLLRLLRSLILAQVLASLLAVVIDAEVFPNNIMLTLTTLIPYSCWLAYFYESKRVKHVFLLHDWDTAVEAIHPEPGMAKLGI